MFGRIAGYTTACFAALLLVVSQAHAVAYDLDPVTTGITDQITATLPIILPIAGGLLALFVAWKLIKRMTSA